jgi:two-component system, chemotaxis family, CheB/CheR fusion protein
LSRARGRSRPRPNEAEGRPIASEPNFFVAGVGISAGGIEALEQLFRPMAADTGIGFVVVAHLAPDKASLLDEIVSRFTAMPVRRPQDGQAVEPNHVYVIAPDTRLTLQDGRLRVHADGVRPSNAIDLLFSSLATDKGERAIGIVLSGSGSDGTLGIKAIKEAGGLTVAQAGDHTPPRHAGMPDSAIATGLVDLAVPVQDMAGRIAEYLRSYEATARSLATTADRRGEDAGALRPRICEILLDQVGHDFSGYKQRTFLRRVQRRMQVVGLTELDAYVGRLRQDPGEVRLLFRDLLIGVTSFLRDQEAFEALSTLVIPQLFEGKGADAAVRVWVPGCATGEEVYSLAMLLCERLQTAQAKPKLQIFGTDIDEAALTVARLGRYPTAALEGVSPERVARFFVEDAGTFQVRKELRDLCIFSLHSLIRDPPFSRIDLVSCRNLLIYLGADLQARVIPVFHYALRPGGFLYLGIAESISHQADLFAPVDKKNRIFQRREHVPARVGFPLLPSSRRALPDPERRAEAPGSGVAVRRAAEMLVLERFAPAHVVVNREGEVVHYSPRTGRYLEAPAGMPSRQLLAMARKGLRLDLRAALHEAMETREPASRAGIAVEVDGHEQQVDLAVEPIGDHDKDPLFLVLFKDVGEPQGVGEAARLRERGSHDPDAARVEADLRDTRERLQSTIEEYETALEELKAANEELVSMNEELQSSNEELETSKEEIQSVNEELQTVNHELAGKLDQLNLANADLRNLFESTQVAVVFLDRELVIRTFTPAVTAIFSLIPTDRGRPLTDIAVNLDHEGLADDARAVIARGDPVERRVAKRDGSVHYLMRILPYHGHDDSVTGALVTFVDITQPVQTEQQLRLLVQELNHRARNLMAVVNAMVRQTLARTVSPEEFAESFAGRIEALARAHGLVARQLWGDVGLAEIVKEELEPHAGEAAGRVEQGGPPVSLTAQAALTLGMVLHELGTNAVKHGALSEPDGRVSVTWSLEDGVGRRQLAIRWKETDGPRVAAPAAKGFGSELIERQVRHEFGGTVVVEYPPEGITVTLTLPEDWRLSGPASRLPATGLAG